jgi:hypothetical protein
MVICGVSCGPRGSSVTEMPALAGVVPDLVS